MDADRNTDNWIVEESDSIVLLLICHMKDSMQESNAFCKKNKKMDMS